MAFKGWPASALEFYEGLEADNSKSYWNENLSTYERDVKAPMLALTAELSEQFGDVKLFRPNRDIRFSTDKSPYKTAIAAMFGGTYYVQLSANGLMAGAGSYHLMPDQLGRYRVAVDRADSGKALEEIGAALVRAGIDFYGSDSLKTAPKGYAKDHPRVELLRHKGLVAAKPWPVEPWLGTAKARQKVIDVYRASRPLVDWLAEHVGDTDDVRGR